jgi:hypothetical protein
VSDIQFETVGYCFHIAESTADLVFPTMLFLFVGVVMYSNRRKLWWLSSAAGALFLLLMICDLMRPDGHTYILSGVCPLP